MADIKKTVEIIFGAIDNTAQGVNSAASNVQNFVDSVSEVSGPLARIGDKALQTEASIIALGATMTGFGVKAASDFDAAFRQISTIIDAPIEDIAKFRAAILDYASTSTQPLEKITNAIAGAVGAGVNYADSLSLLATAEKLSISTRSELDGTTKVLVSTLNSYGLSMSEANNISDLFFKIIDMGDISMNDLAASFAKVAPVAAVAGVSLEEIGAAIATLTAAGLQPAESIEYLRGALGNILSPSAQARDLAADLGIEFNGSGLKAQGFAALIQQVAEKTGGSAAQMKILFGDVGGFTAAATLAGPQAKAFASALEEMKDAAGSTNAAFEKVNGSLEVVGQQLMNSIHSTLISIGDPLLDEFGNIGKAISAIFDAVGDSIRTGSMSALVQYVESAMQGLAEKLDGIAKALPAALERVDFSGLMEAFNSLGGAIGGIFDGFDSSDPDQLAGAIQSVVDSFSSLTHVVKGIADAWGPVVNWMILAVNEFNNLDDATKQTAGNVLGAAQVFEYVLKPALDSVLQIVGGLSSTISHLATAFLGLVAGLAGTTAGMLALGAGAAWGSVEVIKLGLDLGKLLNQTLALRAAQESQQDTAARLANRYAELSAATGLQIRTAEEFNEATKSGALVWDEISASWVAASEASKSLSSATAAIMEGLDGIAGAASKITENGVTTYFDEMGNAVARIVESQDDLDRWNQSLLLSGGVMDEASAAQAVLTTTTDDLIASTRAIVPIYDELTGEIIGYEQNLSAVGKSSKDAAGRQGELSEAAKKTKAEIEAAEKATREWNLEMQKLASAEAIAMIAANSEIAVARIEADAGTMIAAFESVSESIASTSALIAELYGTETADWDRFGFQQRDLIDNANKRANELTAAQIEMLKAQADSLRERTDALRRGESIITINGDGLQPHLEAFMWEILKAIQLRVNADGMEMLLGVQ